MYVIIIIFCLMVIVRTTPGPELADRYRTPISQQSIESSLLAIEERLNSLTNIYSLRYSTPRWELSIETQNRKLETLETKISRIETLLDLRIEKLTESISSKTIREERFKDQINRKIDNTYERLNHRINYMESRLEGTIAKLQTNMDQALTKINTQFEHFEKTINVMESDVLEISTNLEETKSIVNNCSSLANGTNGDGSQSVSSTEQKLMKIEKDIVEQQELFTETVVNINNNISQIMKRNEEMIRKSLDLVNATRRELQDGIKSIKATRRHACPQLEDDAMDYLMDMENSIQSLTRKTDANHQRLDSTISNLHMQQNLFIKSCHRLQQEEPQLENRISDILEKILDSIQNRTELTDKNYETLNEMLKSHHSHMIRTVGHTTNTVLKLNEQFDHSLKSITPNTEMMSNLFNYLVELQDQLTDFNISVSMEKNLTSYLERLMIVTNTIPDIKTISNDIKNISTALEDVKSVCNNFDTKQTDNLFKYEDDEDFKQNNTDIDDIFNIFEMKDEINITSVKDDLLKIEDVDKSSNTEGRILGEHDKPMKEIGINIRTKLFEENNYDNEEDVTNSNSDSDLLGSIQSEDKDKE